MNKNILLAGQSLWRNKSSENKLISENGLYELVLQEHDGNLVLYEIKSDNRFPVFASNHPLPSGQSEALLPYCIAAIRA